MNHVFNDGGRKEAGHQKIVSDCVVRSIAISLELPYQIVYNDLHRLSREFAEKNDCDVALKLRANSSPDIGVYREVYSPYILSHGWTWMQTVENGKPCKVRLRQKAFRNGRFIICVSKHMTAVINGLIHDTHNPSRKGRRCVHGYFRKDSK